MDILKSWMDPPRRAIQARETVWSGVGEAIRKDSLRMEQQAMKVARDAYKFQLDKKATQFVARAGYADPATLFKFLPGVNLPHEPMWFEFDGDVWSREIKRVYSENGAFEAAREIDLNDEARPMGFGCLLYKETETRIRGLNFMSYRSPIDGASSMLTVPDIVDVLIDPVNPLPTPFTEFFTYNGEETIFEHGAASDDEKAQFDGLLRETACGFIGGGKAEKSVKDIDRLGRHIGLAPGKLMFKTEAEMCRLQHGKDAGAKTLFEGIRDRAGWARRVMVILALLCSHDLVEEKGTTKTSVRFGKMKNRFTYKVTNITVRLPQKVDAVAAMTDATRSTARRLHKVRGHWCYRHRGYVRHCDHDFPLGTVQQCRKCGTVRWWRESHYRGDCLKGVNRPDYTVTA